MFNIKDLIKLLEDYKKQDIEKLEKLKNNISSTYLLAKNDFRTIENYEDSIKTLDYVIDMLNILQQRIIERNTEPLI